MLAFMPYPPNGLRRKALCFSVMGVGLLATGVSAWLLVLALGGGGHSNSSGGTTLMGAMDVTSKVSTGIGAILNVVAGIVVLAGGTLKAREVKPF